MKYHIDRNEPLNELDSETQTFGCRAYNPEICKNCMNDTCGLYNESHICTTPPRGWKRQYNYLKSKNTKL